MSFEAAQEEINKWLDHKRVKASVREVQAPNIETLVSAIQYGEASLNHETMEITQPLLFPLKDKDGGTTVLDKLVFKPRVTVGELQEASQSVKVTDFDGKVLAYMALLSGTAVAYIRKIDSEDLKIGQAIAVFFM